MFAGSGLLTPLLAVAASVIALGVVERSRGLIAAGIWATAITVAMRLRDYLGSIPGWVAYLLGGLEEPMPLGGQLTLLGVDRPGPTLILMAAPLIVFAVVRAIRAPGAVK